MLVLGLEGRMKQFLEAFFFEIKTTDSEQGMEQNSQDQLPNKGMGFLICLQKNLPQEPREECGHEVESKQMHSQAINLAIFKEGKYRKENRMSYG